MRPTKDAPLCSTQVVRGEDIGLAIKSTAATPLPAAAPTPEPAPAPAVEPEPELEPEPEPAAEPEPESAEPAPAPKAAAPKVRSGGMQPAPPVAGAGVGATPGRRRQKRGDKKPADLRMVSGPAGIHLLCETSFKLRNIRESRSTVPQNVP